MLPSKKYHQRWIRVFGQLPTTMSYAILVPTRTDVRQRSEMRAGRNVQPLSYDLRLPDAVQADALRLLDVSREADQCHGGCPVGSAGRIW